MVDCHRNLSSFLSSEIGRFTPNGGQAGYHALNPSTALFEVQAHLRESSGDFIVYQNRVEVENILDLTNEDNLKAFGGLEALIAPKGADFYAYQRQIATEIRDAGFNGILVPSAQDLQPNLVLFNNGPGVGVCFMEKSPPVTVFK